MGVEGSVDLHYWITRGMARRLGVNLPDAMRAEILTRADLAEMVNRCRKCGGVQGCLAYLAENPERAPAPPDWCHNAAVLSELSALN
jgi:hypothetical protein